MKKQAAREMKLSSEVWRTLAYMQVNFDAELPHDGEIRAFDKPETNNSVGVTLVAHCLECASKLKVRAARRQGEPSKYGKDDE